jgi:hypothetical protein
MLSEVDVYLDGKIVPSCLIVLVYKLLRDSRMLKCISLAILDVVNAVLGDAIFCAVTGRETTVYLDSCSENVLGWKSSGIDLKLLPRSKEAITVNEIEASLVLYPSRALPDKRKRQR